MDAGERGAGTKDSTEGKVNVKEKEDGIQIPLTFPKEMRIKEKGRGHS